MIRVSVRQLLVASLVVFSLVPAAVVGGLMAANTRQTVDGLAAKIVVDVADRVAADTEGHLLEAHNVFNGLIPKAPGSVQAVAAAALATDPQAFESLAFALTRLSPNVPYLYQGNSAGNFLGVERLRKASAGPVTPAPLQAASAASASSSAAMPALPVPTASDQEIADGAALVRTRQSGDERRRFYQAAQAGDRSKLLSIEERNFDPRERPWYGAAVTARARTFTPAYVSFVHQQLVITLSQPVYAADGSVAGVFAADLFLARLNELWQAQRVSKNGMAYLVDEQGLLVASSGTQALFAVVDGKPARARAESTTNEIIRSSYAALRAMPAQANPPTQASTFGTQAAAVPHAVQRLPLSTGGDLLTVARPFGQQYGLNWRLVVSAPEDDFVGDTRAALQTALATMALVMLLGAVLAVVFAYRVAKRFALLRDAALQLGRGDAPPAQDNARITEVRVLAGAMHASGVSLKAAMAEVAAKAQALREANESLETRVAQRTAQLEASREEALEAVKAKSAFLATMSHEIRTPLNGVVGMTTLMADTPLNHEQRDYLHTMRVSSDQLLGVINDILDFSKIESGKLELEDRPLALRETIEEACEIAASRAREKSVELIVDLDDTVPKWVRGDVTRLRQVLLNFINNAVKFTEAGLIVITARVVEDFSAVAAQGDACASGALLEFRVRDSGIGIPADRIDALFQSFSQVDSSTTRKYGGTGLGLAICKRLAEIMGGAVGVESVLGQGSTFWFTARLGFTDTPVHSESSLIQLTSLSGRRALVVDDSEVNLRILQKHFSDWDMFCAAFARPQDALDWLQTNEVDAIVSDMHMPEMDGAGFARAALRQSMALGRASPPVVLLTSGLLPAGDDAALFDVRLLKPCRQAQLFSALSRVLGRRDASNSVFTPSGAPSILQTVLVVDDNAVNRKVAAAMLGRLRFGAVFAHNGREAVHAVAQSLQAGGQRFAAVLMDANMPEMDGFEASRLICAAHGSSAPPIIAMTGSVFEEDRQACAAAGMLGFVAKPVQLDELAQSLARWVGAGAAPARAPARAAPSFTRSAFGDLGEGATNGLQTRGATRGPQLVPAAAPAPVRAQLDSHMDWARLDEIQAIDDAERSLTRGIVAAFISDVPQRVADLHAALDAGDATALSRAVHALKGAASNVGGWSVSDRCALLESQTKAGRMPPDASAQVDAIEAATIATVAALIARNPSAGA